MCPYLAPNNLELVSKIIHQIKLLINKITYSAKNFPIHIPTYSQFPILPAVRRVTDDMLP